MGMSRRNVFPAGAMLNFAGNTAPSGWLECDGSSLLRASYPNLFSAIGTTYGSVDSTHFTLPDMRGEFIRGWDHGRGIDAARTMGSAQVEQVGPHTHYLFNNASSASGDMTTNETPQGVTAEGDDYSTRIGGNSSAADRGKSGQGSGTETRPRNIAMMFIIKV